MTRPQVRPADLHQDFQVIFKAHVGLVQHIARQFRLSSEESDEVVQEVFMRLYKSMNQIQDPNKIRSWISTTTRRVIIDRFRQNRTRKTASAGEAIDSMVYQDASHSTVQRELEAIAITQWLNEVGHLDGGEVLKKFYIEGQTARQIAEERGEATSTVTARLSRLRQRFSERLAEIIESLNAETGMLHDEAN